MTKHGPVDDYNRGYTDGTAETRLLVGDLIDATSDLLEHWPSNKNLSAKIQAVQRALRALRDDGTHVHRLDEQEGDH